MTRLRMIRLRMTRLRTLVVVGSSSSPVCSSGCEARGAAAASSFSWEEGTGCSSTFLNLAAGGLCSGRAFFLLFFGGVRRAEARLGAGEATTSSWGGRSVVLGDGDGQRGGVLASGRGRLAAASSKGALGGGSTGGAFSGAGTTAVLLAEGGAATARAALSLSAASAPPRKWL